VADRGKDVYDKARDAVNRGTEEAQRYVRDTASSVSSGPSSSPARRTAPKASAAAALVPPVRRRARWSATELTMTSATARTVANVVLASAGVAAAYVVMTRPPLRRLAIRATQLWLGASGRCISSPRHGGPG